MPFTSLGISNITDLTGLWIEGRVVNGVSPWAFSLDDVELVGNDEFNGISTATITLAGLAQTYNGSPRPVTATTLPAGLPVVFTYNGSATPPTTAGTYSVSASIDDPSIIGSATGTLVISKAGASILLANLSPSADGTPKTPTPSTPSSPLLNPNDTTDAFSTNTLQAHFSPITLANTGDRITLTGNLQMTLPAVASQSNWFRFGLYDNLGQAPGIATGWLGYTGMGNSLFERTANGLFSTGAGATQRTSDASPAPVSSTSPSGNPPLTFEVSITRTASGVVVTHFIRRTDTNAVLMNYSFTDTTPNNNGLLGSAQGTANGYTPTFNTAGFAFARGYIGT
ncbi:MAG: hypothetical protein CFE44_15555, partial [Burkholderiales bacterium PBB4]